MTDRKNLIIGSLAAIALMLGLGHLQLNQPAEAAVVAVGRDYQLVTALIARGGDGLYILDNRTGLVALFTWDNGAKRVVAKDIRPMVELMGR